MPDDAEVYNSYAPNAEEDEDLYNAYGSYEKDDHAPIVQDTSLEKYQKKEDIKQNQEGWNARFLAALQMPNDTEEQSFNKYLTLTQLSADFVETAKTYGKMIISEIMLPVEQKTLRPIGMGGVAGGKKYIARDILFKLVDDPETRGGFIYGGSEANYEFAAKAAGHELRGARSYFSAFERLKAKNLGNAYVPMQVVVDYRGFRLTAMPLLPLKKINGKSTLVYGSDDTGRSIHADDPVVNKLMQDAGEDLHLAAHVVCDKVIHAGGDVEGHIGNDGNIYVLDLARTFPPQARRINKHLPIVGQPEFYRMFRGEYLQIRKSLGKPALSPDALTNWGRIDGKPHNLACIEATVDLVEKFIPQYAHKLDEDEKHQLEEPVSEHLHRHGINVHHIGLLRHHLQAPKNRALFLVEIVGRVLKNLLRATLRNITERNKQNPSEYVLNVQTAGFLNLVSGADKRSEDFLNNAVVSGIKLRFGQDAITDVEEEDLASAVEPLKPRIVKYLLVMTGIQLSPGCLDDFAKNPKGFKFTVADIVGSNARVKHTSILDYANGQLMEMQSEKEKENETSLRLVSLSARSFAQVLRSEPMHLEAEFHWTMARLKELELQENYVEADNFVLDKLVHFKKHVPEEEKKEEKKQDPENKAVVDPGEYATILFKRTWEIWEARIRKPTDAPSRTPCYLILGASSRLALVRMLQMFPEYANEKQTADMKAALKERLTKLKDLKARLKSLAGEDFAGARIKEEIGSAVADLRAALSGEVLAHFMEDKPWAEDHMLTFFDRFVNYAVQEGDAYTVKLLLDCGARTEALDPQKRTSLLVGCIGGRRKMVRPQIVPMLLEARANINAQDQSGNSALHLAAQNDAPKIVRELLTRGADPLLVNTQGYRADQGAADSCVHILEEASSKKKKIVTEAERKRNLSILRKQGKAATAGKKASESDKPQQSTLHKHKLKKTVAGPYGYECDNCSKKFEDDGEEFLQSWNCKKCKYNLCDVCLDLTCKEKKSSGPLPTSIRHPEHFLIKSDDVLADSKECELCAKECNRELWSCPNTDCDFHLCDVCFQYTRMKAGAINTLYINYLSELIKQDEKKVKKPGGGEDDEEDPVDDEEEEDEEAKGAKDAAGEESDEENKLKTKAINIIKVTPANKAGPAATVKPDEHGIWIESNGEKQTVLANMLVKKGKWYFEAQYDQGASIIIGAATPKFNGVTGLGAEGDSWGYEGLAQSKWHKGKHAFDSPDFKQWSVVGIALDLDSRPNTFRVYLDGKDLGIAFSNMKIDDGIKVGATLSGVGTRICLVFNEADLRQELPRGFSTFEKRREDSKALKALRYKCVAKDLPIKDRPHGKTVTKMLRDDVIYSFVSNGGWIRTGRGWISTVWQGQPLLVKEEDNKKGDVYYFEVEVEEVGEENGLSIGLTGPNYPLDMQPGRKPGSYAYHSASGEITGLKLDGSPAVKDKEIGEQLRLVGIPNGELRADRMGVFNQQAEICGGFPTFLHENGLTACWYHNGKNQWIVGDKKNVGTSTGTIYIAARAPCPADVKETWSKWTGSAWEPDARIKFERIGVCVLPKLEVVTRPMVVVTGIADGEPRSDRMGVYEQEPVRKRSDRPVFKQKGGNSCLWYDQGKNQYIIGDAANVETTTGAIYSPAGTAKNPWDVTSVWSRYNNQWEQCAAVKVLKGEEVNLSGFAPTHTCAGKMGRYIATRQSDERFVYQQENGDMWMWYLKEKNQWIIGGKENIGKGTGFIFVAAGEADRPYKVTNVWRWWDATAPGAWKDGPEMKSTLKQPSEAAEEQEKALPWGPAWLAGDTIGCGYDSARKEIFFTRNSEHLGVAFINVEVNDLFPTIGFSSPNEKVNVNFGKTTFAFNGSSLKSQPKLALERISEGVVLAEKKGKVGLSAAHPDKGPGIAQVAAAFNKN